MSQSYPPGNDPTRATRGNRSVESRITPLSHRNRVACGLLSRVRMDAAEFDRLVARVSDPRLIPDIYNYCDGRCRRCPFTQRCLVYLDSQDLDAVNLDKHSLSVTMGASLRRMLGLRSEAAQRPCALRLQEAPRRARIRDPCTGSLPR